MEELRKKCSGKMFREDSDIHETSGTKVGSGQTSRSCGWRDHGDWENSDKTGLVRTIPIPPKDKTHESIVNVKNRVIFP